MLATNSMKKYSQNDEELFILDYFKSKSNGKFIDVGSYDVYRFSNIRALYDTGKWGGVLVEPAPKNYQGIADHYANDKRITVLNVAIGDKEGEIDFYESNGDAVSTTEKHHMQKWADAGVEFTKIKVPQLNIVDFMLEYGKDANMLSIDTEATNMVIFRAMEDWVWERISLLVIEHDLHQEEIENKLSKFGFKTLYQNAENILLAKTNTL